jgi:hypothetical protein
MRFISIVVVLALGMWAGSSHTASAQSLRAPGTAEGPLRLRAELRIEPRLAREAAADLPEDEALALQPEAQLSETSVLGAVSGRSFRDEESQAGRPWFDRVRPLLEMAR